MLCEAGPGVECGGGGAVMLFFTVRSLSETRADIGVQADKDRGSAESKKKEIVWVMLHCNYCREELSESRL